MSRGGFEVGRAIAQAMRESVPVIRRDFAELARAMTLLGGLRVPELMAATELSEPRACRALAWALGNGWVARRPEDDEWTLTRAYWDVWRAVQAADRAFAGL